MLEQGYRVRATVRDPNSSKNDFLKVLLGATERLELVVANLLSEQGWTEAVSDCTYVLHIASPYRLHVKNPQIDLIEPAVKGTLNVFKACQAEVKVKRVVLCSSVAALSDCFDDWKTHAYGPDDWNTTSSLRRNPYYYSKTLAEKAAHEFMKQENVSFSLSVINPYQVIGPALDTKSRQNQTVDSVTMYFTGPGIALPLALGCVDVRDVALAHVRAMQIDEAGGGKRFVLCPRTVPQQEVARLIRDACPEKLKRRINTKKPPPIPKPIMIAVVQMIESKEVASFVKHNWKKEPKFDCSMARDILKIEFHDAATSIQDTVRWCIEYKKV